MRFQDLPEEDWNAIITRVARAQKLIAEAYEIADQVDSCPMLDALDEAHSATVAAGDAVIDAYMEAKK